MRFRWEPGSHGRSGVIAVPEAGDSLPLVDGLWLDHVAEPVHADRFAAAAALLFASRTRSRLKFPEAVSPSVAQAIEALDPLGRRRVDSVLVSAAPSPRGGAILVLGADDPGASVANARGRQRRVALNVLRTDRYSGGLLTMDSLSVASNAWLHTDDRGTALQAFLPYVAVGILLADELGIGGLELSADLLASDDDLTSRLTLLCNAVGLSLSPL